MVVPPCSYVAKWCEDGCVPSGSCALPVDDILHVQHVVVLPIKKKLGGVVFLAKNVNFQSQKYSQAWIDEHLMEEAHSDSVLLIGIMSMYSR